MFLVLQYFLKAQAARFSCVAKPQKNNKPLYKRAWPRYNVPVIE